MSLSLQQGHGLLSAKSAPVPAAPVLRVEVSGHGCHPKAEASPGPAVSGSASRAQLSSYKKLQPLSAVKRVPSSHSIRLYSQPVRKTEVPQLQRTCAQTTRGRFPPD